MLNDAAKAEESLVTESLNEKIDRLNALSRKHYGSNCNRALSIARKALALSKEHGYEKGWAQSLVSMSMAYSRMSQCDMSITSLFEAIPLLQKTGEKVEEVKALNLVGINYFFYSRLDQALEYYNKSMNLAAEIGDETFTCKILNNIGEIYNEMNKLDEAMEYYRKCFKAASKTRDIFGKAIALSNMGQVSFKLGHNPDALKYYRQSNAIMQKVNDKIYLADNMNKIGEVYRKLGVDKKALDYYFKSLRIFEEQREKFYQTDVYINLSFLYIGKKEYERAADSLKTALAVAESISARKKVYSIHNHLTNLYESMGDYKNALYHYKLHHKVERDVSIEELERQLNMAKMQYQIEQAQKEADIVRLKNTELKKKADELASVNSRLSIEISKRKTAQKSLEEANQRLENLLLTDALTGIFNRRGFEKSLGSEWRRSVREGTPLSIILIDIDFFKEYNDRHGHIAGDACLKKVSGILQSAVERPTDFIARYGGEEFIVILPNTAADRALILAEKLRESVEASKIAHGRSTVSPYLTISLGTSTIISTMSHSKKEFVNSADQALYKAKQSGRNRVCSS